MWHPAVIYLFIYLLEIEGHPHERPVVITKYAKVARWGQNENDTSTVTSLPPRHGNISNHRIGQSLRLGKTTVNLMDKYNPRQNQRVAYQYPVYRRIDDDADTDNLPPIGEVAAFSDPQESSKNHADAVYGPPKLPDAVSTSASIPNAPLSSPVGLYSSPYSSYNPPKLDTKSNNNAELYPPLNHDSYAAPPPASGPGVYDIKTSSKSQKNVESTLGPPVAPVSSGIDDFHSVDAPPSDHGSDYMDHGPPVYQSFDHPQNVDGEKHYAHKSPKYAPSFNDEPPNFPPKSIDDIYDPSEISGGQSDMMGPMQEEMPKSITDAYHPSDFSYGGNGGGIDEPPVIPQLDMTADLYPPAVYDHDHHYPKYLYDTPHYDHHIYEEIPHIIPTTTEAPRKKHGYTYYFLGKKLYFIPLYFSIYFVIYITILILKAFVRHKIQFKYDWISAHSREAKQLTFDRIKTIDEIHKNVTEGIDKVADMYSKIAM